MTSITIKERSDSSSEEEIDELFEQIVWDIIIDHLSE